MSTFQLSEVNPELIPKELPERPTPSLLFHSRVLLLEAFQDPSRNHHPSEPKYLERENSLHKQPCTLKMPALGKLKATHNSKYKFLLNGKEKRKKKVNLYLDHLIIEHSMGKK